ncbi:GNAT family N-acetyltransferase [Streptomyces laurentii]|uniref:GNAT family N-acetyltransferase n=1 Tax=Streptomyces laurentii TaxID=39478 RepID=UPI0026B74A1D
MAKARAVTWSEPGADGLGEAVGVLREWRAEGTPAQLHPGDLGWFWRSGAAATAAAVRLWRGHGGRVLAVGLLDGPDLLRLAFAPDVRRNEELARRLAGDVTEPGHGVLPEGRVNVEAPADSPLLDLLAAEYGWRTDEPWTPLARGLADPVEEPGVRVEVVGPERAEAFAAVHRSAFGGRRFTAERWHAMAAGLPYADGRSLVAYDGRGEPVAAVAVWSAGPGRPGLLEPMGVHAGHRGRGYGAAITRAAAAALRELGASSATVSTPTANTAAVATYEAAGFHRRPETHDRYRDASNRP